MSGLMLKGYTAGPDAGTDMNAGPGAGPVQSSVVAVASQDFWENLPSLICSYLNLNFGHGKT